MHLAEAQPHATPAGDFVRKQNIVPFKLALSQYLEAACPEARQWLSLYRVGSSPGHVIQNAVTCTELKWSYARIRPESRIADNVSTPAKFGGRTDRGQPLPISNKWLY